MAATYSPTQAGLGDGNINISESVSIKNSVNRSFGGRIRKSESNQNLNLSESEIQNTGKKSHNP